MWEYMASLEPQWVRRVMIWRNMEAVGFHRVLLELVQLAVAYVQRAFIVVAAAGRRDRTRSPVASNE